MTLRLRHLAEVNPATPEFDRLSSDDYLTFLPLEAVWPDSRLDVSRKRTKGDVAVGYTRFREGDIIVPKVTPTFQAGRSAIAKGLVGSVGAGSTELHVLRARPEVDARFLRYIVLSAPFLTEGVSAFQGVAGLQRVTDEFVRDFPVTGFPMEEQRRIADFLDAETGQIDSVVELQKQVRSRVLERREARMVSEAVGRRYPILRASGIPWVDMIPAEWSSVKVGLLARMGSGHTPSRSRPDWWVGGDIPWITTGEVSQLRNDRREMITETREKISTVGLANSSAEIHPVGTVVLCRTAASAGYSAVMGIDMATSQDFATWTCGPRLDPYYLLWCLRAMRRDLLGRLAMGSTHKTIYVPDLQTLKIPLPSIPEQRKIVDRIRAGNIKNDGLVDAIDRQLALLAERRQALITAAVTGEIDVTTAKGVDVS